MKLLKIKSYFFIKSTRGKNISKFWVCPCNLPDRSIMSNKSISLRKFSLYALIEASSTVVSPWAELSLVTSKICIDPYQMTLIFFLVFTIWRTSSHSSTIIIILYIVLEILFIFQSKCYYHSFMLGINKTSLLYHFPRISSDVFFLI